mmetsp:Transcript_81924/g.220201  ORF Transcript_81924/g.220201 Transcript_81924/m.220201 type:complete len:223 (-) Transcript_81924:89-757(-)
MRAVKTSWSSWRSASSYAFFSRVDWKLRFNVSREPSKPLIRVCMSATPPSASAFMRCLSARSEPKCSKSVTTWLNTMRLLSSNSLHSTSIPSSCSQASYIMLFKYTRPLASDTSLNWPVVFFPSPPERRSSDCTSLGSLSSTSGSASLNFIFLCTLSAMCRVVVPLLRSMSCTMYPTFARKLVPAAVRFTTLSAPERRRAARPSAQRARARARSSISLIAAG